MITNTRLDELAATDGPWLQDAERYRWLHTHKPATILKDVFGKWVLGRHDLKLDCEIDAALKGPTS